MTTEEKEKVKKEIEAHLLTLKYMVSRGDFDWVMRNRLFEAIYYDGKPKLILSSPSRYLSSNKLIEEII